MKEKSAENNFLHLFSSFVIGDANIKLLFVNFCQSPHLEEMYYWK